MTIYTHTAGDRTPYTYIITCKTTSMSYYGSKYAKDCHPDGLWESYFTSSKTINALIELYGKDDFTFEIRKIFKSVKECTLWESKVNSRLTVKSEKFYNIDDNQMPHKTIQLRMPTRKISNIKLGICITIPKENSTPNGWTDGNINRKGLRTNCTVWCHNPNTGKHKMVKDESYIPEGFIRGRINSSNSKELKDKYSWVINTDTQTSELVLRGSKLKPTQIYGRIAPKVRM